MSCLVYVTCPIVQVHAYNCLPRLLHLLSLPSLLCLPSFAWLVYFPIAIAAYIVSYACLLFKLTLPTMPIITGIDAIYLACL